MNRLAELVRSRDLAVNLTLRELRSRYKRSVLGWGWSLLNPILTIAIYWVVFGAFLKVVPPVGHPSGLSSFLLFLICALIPWGFLSRAIDSTPDAIVSNGNLIKKVFFPRELLVASAVGSLFVTFLIEMAVVCVVLLIAGNMVLPWIPVLVFTMALETLFVFGIGLVLSVVNVYFRDVKHFTTIALQALFYSAPVVYPIRLVPLHSQIAGINVPFRRIYELNPLVRMVDVYRAVLYDLRFPDLGDVLYLIAWTAGLLLFGWYVFGKLEPRLAEEV
jgi:lipopolysaccharide transport system permease protein